jgi:Spy/CpxP family protein refolding chaperone
MAASLQLTPAQRQQIKRLRQETRRGLADEQAQLRQLTLQLREAWQSPQPNERQILGLRQRIAALRAVVQEQHVRLRLSVLALLTPDQRAVSRRALAEPAARGPRRPMSRPVRIATP